MAGLGIEGSDDGWDHPRAAAKSGCLRSSASVNRRLLFLIALLSIMMQAAAVLMSMDEH